MTDKFVSSSVVICSNLLPVTSTVPGSSVVSGFNALPGLKALPGLNDATRKQTQQKMTTGGQSLLKRICFGALIPLAVVLSGCGDPIWLPRAHKIEVQQGNILTAENIEAIQAGMSREEVASLVGVPLTISSFHSNRWDYPFTRGPAGTTIEAKRFSVFFDNNVVINTAENFSEESGEFTVPQFWFQSPKRVKVPAASVAQP